jgi:hypothetical protein
MALRKVRAGERIELEAATWNAFCDAAAAHQASRHTLHVPGATGAPGQSLVFVRNDSGADRARFDVLALGQPLFLPGDALVEFQSRASFQGIAPVADTHLESFVVLQEPIRDGGVGLGLVAGVTACQVFVEYESDAYAGVGDGHFDRLLGGDGGARILWKEPGDGLKWALVLLGVSCTERRFQLIGPLTPGGTAQAQVRRWAGSSWVTTAQQFEVTDPAQMFLGTSGQLGEARWKPDSRKWEVYQLACGG